MPGTAVDLRSELAARLACARERTDMFFELFTPYALYERAIPERHRIVFYLGHLEAFDWNLLGRQVLGLEEFDAEFDRLFAFGIDPVDGHLPADRPEDWPGIEQIRDYNLRVRRMLDEALDAAEFDPALAPHGLENGHALEIAVEHRLMHAETLAYMLPHLPPGAFARGAVVRPDAQPGPRRAGYARTGDPAQHFVRADAVEGGHAVEHGNGDLHQATLSILPPPAGRKRSR